MLVIQMHVFRGVFPPRDASGPEMKKEVQESVEESP